MDLKGQIEIKEKELLELHELYNNEIEQAKDAVLKAKGFSRVLYLLGFEFESSSGRTEQYLEFHRIFKKEISDLLKPYITEIKVSSPNHFDVTGFFKTIKGGIYYFSLGDLRHNTFGEYSMMIRTAKDFQDYTGGQNCFISMNQQFPERLIEFIKED